MVSARVAEMSEAQVRKALAEVVSAAFADDSPTEYEVAVGNHGLDRDQLEGRFGPAEES